MGAAFGLGDDADAAPLEVAALLVAARPVTVAIFAWRVDEERVDEEVVPLVEAFAWEPDAEPAPLGPAGSRSMRLPTTSRPPVSTMPIGLRSLCVWAARWCTVPPVPPVGFAGPPSPRAQHCPVLPTGQNAIGQAP